MIGVRRRPRSALPVLLAASAVLAGMLLAALAASSHAAAPSGKAAGPTFADATASDVSEPLAQLVAESEPATSLPPATGRDTDREPEVVGGVTTSAARGAARPSPFAPLAAAAGPPIIRNFEGISNQDNFNIFGFRVNPPDPVGDVGPNHYVEMVNLAFAVYDKTGNVLLGPADIGSLWTGFAVDDCTDPSGDPIVLYDQFADRWILSQFTTRFTPNPQNDVFYICIAISQTGDPTGAYYRYAFPTGNFFPDYPKYGVWKDSYVFTTREFGPTVEYGIGVYAIDRNKMINGQSARVVSFFVDGNDPAKLPLVGDGLLPADVDGKTKPKQNVPIPIVGTQDDGHPYGATFDALNVWELDVHWNAKAGDEATFELAAQLPVAAFDSLFPCGPSSRDCLPQPGITNPAQFLDVLSYRQRPIHRLAYRSFKGYESMVTNQSVEASPNVAGTRWYEIRRDGAGNYSVFQQGTYSPDSVHRWMGSIAQDKKGNMALGYSVVDGTSVKPGIRVTGRLAGDTAGSMGSVGEATVVDGTGVQTTANSRWGDYTSMNIDPVDDCTFWYVNEYYTAAGQASSPAGWQTRIASFKLPGCN